VIQFLSVCGEPDHLQVQRHKVPFELDSYFVIVRYFLSSSWTNWKFVLAFVELEKGHMHAAERLKRYPSLLVGSLCSDSSMFRGCCQTEYEVV